MNKLSRVFASLAPASAPTPFRSARRAVRAAALGLVAGFVITPVTQAFAQERTEAMPGGTATPVPDRKIPTLGCCRCLGEKNTLDLGTHAGNPWRVNGMPAVIVTSPNAAWSPSPGSAKWISTNAAGNGGANATYRYTLQFRVEKCVIPQSIVFKGLSVAADNRYSVSLSGPAGASPSVPCPAAAAATGHCFSVAGRLNNFAVWPVIPPGVYTLNVDVTNISGPSGLSLDAVLEGRCSKDPIKPEKDQSL